MNTRPCADAICKHLADSSFQRLNRWLLVLVLVELLLGGNGYLIEIGGIRLRVLLFCLCMASVAVHFLARPSNSLAWEIWFLMALFAAICAIGIATGMLHGNPTSFILAELKALSYFPMLLFFAITIRNFNDIQLTVRLIIRCGILQAVLFIGLLILMHGGVLGYSSVYSFLSQSDEFIFRHNPDDVFFVGFFYKGAFHLAIAGLFLLFYPSKKNFLLALLMILALALSMTRGLMAALLVSLALAALFVPRRDWLLMLVFAITVGTTALLLTQGLTLLQRPVSDQIRINDIRLIAEQLGVSDALLGKGMGAPIGERSRIEITYLEVFFKQGLVGLSLWAALLLVNIRAFLRMRGSARMLALPFLLSTFFVYAATATNTFLTGSIGMSTVLLSTTSLLALGNLSMARKTLGPAPRRALGFQG